MSGPRPDTRRSALVALLVAIALAVADAGAADPELLPAERAFALSAQGVDSLSLRVRIDIADGNYLYRDKFVFSVADAPILSPALPPGVVKEDRFFGRVETYRDRVEVVLVLERPTPGRTVTLTVDSQGCADRGVCYPAQRQTLALPMPRPGESPRPVVEAAPRRRSWFN